jgi:prepilin-type N-terminal cleavage/methylation domain-containing protein/prepilin-type processing-associated H-X9-DG protein
MADTNGHDRRDRHGFSLVELLVVIGIIALLIAILLPALSRAREQANAVQCLATLRNIGMAAQMHAQEHQGYLPAAGWQWNSVGGVTNPSGLEDESERRYEYYLDDGIKRPVPASVALAKYMGVTCRTDSRANLEADLQLESIRRLFRCPSQQVEYHGWTQRGDDGGAWTAPEEYSSYAFNEALLGRRPAHLETCPKGNLSRVTQPSKVMFALDGRPRDLNGPGNRNFLVPDADSVAFPEETLYEFQQRNAEAPPGQGGKELLDFLRHRFRINVVFCDGHAESFPMGLPPEGGPGLKEIYVTRGISW